MSFENNKMSTLPTLPIEIINDIKYKYGGLEHPTAKIIKNITVFLHFTKLNNPLGPPYPTFKINNPRPPYSKFEIKNYWMYEYGLMGWNGLSAKNYL